MAHEFLDAYEVLGVDPECSQAELKAAHRRLVRRHHPDVAPQSEREAATRRMQRINVAYALVRDPSRRARYDAVRAAQRTDAGDPWPQDPGLAAEWESMVVAAGRWAGRFWERHRPPPAPSLARGFGRTVGRIRRQVWQAGQK